MSPGQLVAIRAELKELGKKQNRAVAPNLLNINFETGKPNAVWVENITWSSFSF